MFKSLFFVAALTALTAAAPSPHVFEIDLTPEQAQEFIKSPPFTDPQLSVRTAVLPLVRYDDPRFRSADAGPSLGHYWRNGKEIENTADYDEEVYDVSQYHGQDGLGGFGYGYVGPDSSKVENRVPAGDVTGSYVFRSGKDLIKVRYWADHDGFHQEDNLPKVVLEPAQETEEVRQARLAHEKAWQEAAEAAAQQPDPQGEYHAEQYETAASEPQQSSIAVAASAPQVSEPREGKAYFAQAQSSFQSGQGQGTYQGQYQGKGQGRYQTSQGHQASAQAQYQSGGQKQQYHGKNEDVEPTGPPRGFFYSFNYPASIIVPKNAAGEEHHHLHPGTSIDHDTVGVGFSSQ